MGACIDESDIANITNFKNRNGEPVTMVTFTNFTARQKVYKRRTALRTTKDIWVNEDLTPARRQLNYQARELYKEGIIAKNWTFEGHIFIKVSNTGPVLNISDRKALMTAAGISE